MNAYTEKKSLKPVIFSVFMAIMIVLILIWNNMVTGNTADTEPVEGAVSFSFLLDKTDSTEYYLSYNENPIVQYITHKRTFMGSDGEDHYITFDFQTMPEGSQTDTINTLLSTRSYPDVMSTTFVGTSIPELYENGIALDLTDYVNKYMPNYLAYLEQHPDQKKNATYTVNGEQRFLCLTGYPALIDYYVDQFCGLCYRRDWIVKYGTNPVTGEGFSGYYSLDKNGNAIHQETWSEDVNGDSWVDDVVFPCGETNPVYVSDWEWMFEIFENAMAAEGIDDGYCMSLYYPGYIANGDLVSGFGGIGVLWYLDRDGKIKFGADTDGMKAYLTCMRAWYEKGWLDQRFMERSGDMFYRIDETSFRQGKVGLWMGSSSTLGARLHNDQLPHCKDIMVFGAASPINDKYGDESVQGKEPIAYYNPSGSVGTQFIVTDKASEKDIAIFCSFADYLYTEEGAYLNFFGLNAEQAAEYPAALYAKYGYENGTYTVVTGEDGQKMIRLAPGLLDSPDLRVALEMGRIKVGMNNPAAIDYGYPDAYVNSYAQWSRYDSFGFSTIPCLRLTAEQQSQQAKVKVRIEQEYMYTEVPKFITGQYNLESDWNNYCTDLSKRRYKNITQYYQEAYDQN